MIKLKSLLSDNLAYPTKADGDVAEFAEKKKDRWEFDHSQNVGLQIAASPLEETNVVDESSIIVGEPFKYLYKELEKGLANFFTNSDNPYLQRAKQPNSRARIIFEYDVTLPVTTKTGDPHDIIIHLIIYPSGMFDNTIDSQTSKQARAYFRKNSDFDGEIVIFLDKFFKILNSDLTGNINPLSYKDDDFRKSLWKASNDKTALLAAIKHESSHAIKQFIHGMPEMPGKSRDKYTAAIFDPSISLLKYSEIGDERESILAEISGEIQQFAKINKTASFYTSINASESMRRLMIGMLDLKKIESDKNPKFTLFLKNGKTRVALNNNSTFDSDVIKYILPKYQGKFKMYIKKLLEWWKKTYPKRGIK